MNPSNPSQEEVIASIKEWIRLDNQLTRLKRDTKTTRQQKQQVSERLTQTMMQNKIDTYAIKNGELVCKTKTSKQAISKKYLMEQLYAYYADDNEEADNVVNLLLTNRKTKVKEELCCKMHTAKKAKPNPSATTEESKEESKE